MKEALVNMERSEQELYDFIENTLIDTFIRLAKVNVVTGEYVYLKQDTDIKNDLSGISDIYEYMKKLASEKYVYPEFIQEFLKFSDPEYVRKRVFSGEKMIVYRYRRRTPDGGKWVNFSITTSGHCSPEEPWVVFGLRESDTDSTALTDAMSALSAIYYKILKINLTNDSFEVIKAEDSDRPGPEITKITEWLKNFADSGNVHEEDLEIYRRFTEKENITGHFRRKRSRLSVRYRRKHSDGGFRWAQMDILPGLDNSDDNVNLLLFVKDVHDEHMAELRHRQELVDNFNRDALTLLYNRHKFNDDLEILNKDMPELVTCLYIDVNGLHEINNLLGHQKGDDMLCCIADTLKMYFPEERMYRIGGDEFVMMSRKLTAADVERITAEVKKTLLENEYEISTGTESGGYDSSVYRIVGAAELKMRKDKEMFYKQNAGIRKRRTANEELEKLLIEKKDAEYFLKLIATKYAGVYFVDMERDSMRYIYIPEYFKNLLERASFSFIKAMEIYARKYVEAGYYDDFLKLLDSSALIKRLEEKGHVEFNYKKVNGADMKLKIIKAGEKSEENTETVWIFAGDEADLC